MTPEFILWNRFYIDLKMLDASKWIKIISIWSRKLNFELNLLHFLGAEESRVFSDTIYPCTTSRVGVLCWYDDNVSQHNMTQLNTTSYWFEAYTSTKRLEENTNYCACKMLYFATKFFSILLIKCQQIWWTHGFDMNDSSDILSPEKSSPNLNIEILWKEFVFFSSPSFCELIQYNRSQWNSFSWTKMLAHWKIINSKCSYRDMLANVV